MFQQLAHQYLMKKLLCMPNLKYPETYLNN